MNMELGTGTRASVARRWSPLKKCCAICSCVTVLIVVIMIPLADFVIVPNMAQSTIDGTTVTLNNVSLVLPPGFFEDATNITLVNNITMNVPGPIGARVHAWRATLATTGGEMGYFEFPELDAVVGINILNFSALMTITNSTNAIAFASNLMVNIPMPLIITGDPDVTAFVFTATPHQHKKLRCVGTENTVTPVMSVGISCAQTSKEMIAPVAVFPEISAPPPAIKALAPAALPNCSQTACPAKCKCGIEKCTTEINDCLADPGCARGESCANKCPCGSNVCLANCAVKHPSAQGFKVLACVEKACPSAAADIMLPAGKAGVPAAFEMLDCKTSACPARCICGTEKCAPEIKACLDDPGCAGGPTCALNNCTCSSTTCLQQCFAFQPSVKGFAVLHCVQKACPQTAEPHALVV